MATVKQSLRRQNVMGRGHSRRPGQQTVRTLAAAALTRKNDFYSVLDALKFYREALSDGTLKMPPSKVFKVEECNWMYAD